MLPPYDKGSENLHPDRQQIQGTIADKVCICYIWTPKIFLCNQSHLYDYLSAGVFASVLD